MKTLRITATLILLLPVLGVAQAKAAAAPRAQTNVKVFSAGGPWMGVGVDDVTADNISRLKMKEERGVEIVTISHDGPAEKAGLKEHDVVLEYNGTHVEGVEQFRRLIHETPAGRTVKLLISRDGAQQGVQVKLGDRPTGRIFRSDGDNFVFAMPPMPPQPAMPAMPSTPRIPRAAPFPDNWFSFSDTPRLGIEGDAVGKQLGEFFGVPGNEGVLVRAVTAGSAAEKAGIKAGDVIVKIDGHAVRDLNDVRDRMRNRSENSAFPVVVIRNKKEMTVTVKLERQEAPGDRV